MIGMTAHFTGVISGKHVHLMLVVIGKNIHLTLVISGKNTHVVIVVIRKNVHPIVMITVNSFHLTLLVDDLLIISAAACYHVVLVVIGEKCSPYADGQWRCAHLTPVIGDKNASLGRMSSWCYWSVQGIHTLLWKLVGRMSTLQG